MKIKGRIFCTVGLLNISYVNAGGSEKLSHIVNRDFVGKFVGVKCGSKLFEESNITGLRRKRFEDLSFLKLALRFNPSSRYFAVLTSLRDR